MIPVFYHIPAFSRNRYLQFWRGVLYCGLESLFQGGVRFPTGGIARDRPCTKAADPV